MKRLLYLLLIAGVCIALRPAFCGAQAPTPTPVRPPHPTVVALQALRQCPDGLPIATIYTALITATANPAAVESATRQCYEKNAVRHLQRMRAAQKAGKAEERGKQALLFDEAAESAERELTYFRIKPEEKTFTECIVRIAQEDGLRAAKREAVRLTKTRPPKPVRRAHR